MDLFNKGDTACLILNYQLNGNPLEEGAYDEIEFQINPQNDLNSIKKLLSNGDIEWNSVEYTEGGETKTFTGYVTYLSQEETFKLRIGNSPCQIRILIGDEVGSSEISDLSLGRVLSRKVLV